MSRALRSSLLHASCVLVAAISAGAILAGAEGIYLLETQDLDSPRYLTWAVLAYGTVALAGVGILYLLRRLVRSSSPNMSPSAVFVNFTLAGGLIIASVHCIEHVAPIIGITRVFAAILLITFVVFIAKKRVVSRLPEGTSKLFFGFGCIFYLLAATVPLLFPRAPEVLRVRPDISGIPAASGPNIILIGLDTLRADALRLYNAEASARTDALEEVAKDAIVFSQGSGQAASTKAAFATIFSGLYPSTHTATGATEVLPESVETVAEILQAHGYYTKGFANNPNLCIAFGFDQGFVDYDELHTTRRLWAQLDGTATAIYKLYERYSRIRVTDFYYPAEDVTQHALSWLDGKSFEDKPFFLFLHYMDTHDPYMDPSAWGGGYCWKRLKWPKEQLRTDMLAAYMRSRR